MTQQKWKVLSEQDVSPSTWFPIVKDLVELPNGKTFEYYKSKLANVSMVVPITKNREVLFVKQYKHGIAEVTLEFPAGRIENNKTAKETAVLELSEETGVIVSEAELIELIELWTEPSKSTVRVYGYLATNVEVAQQQKLEETESIEIVKVPVSELDQLIKSGEVHASDTIALLLPAKKQFHQFFI